MKRSGVSDVFTSLILVMTSVSLATILFFWAMGYLGQSQNAIGTGIALGNSRVQEQLSVEQVRFCMNASNDPLATKLSGLTTPESVVFDSSGNLWVSVNGPGQGEVLRFSAPVSSSSVASLTITTGISLPRGLAFDSSGNLWVANTGSNTVVEFTKSSGFTATGTTISSGISQPDGLAFDSSGNLWVANTGSSSVSGYKSPYTGAASYKVSAGITTPHGIAFDTAGRLWVANTGGSDVLAFVSLTSTPSQAVSISTGLSSPQALTFDSGGDLWLSNTGAGTVLEFSSPASSPTLVLTLSDSFSSPTGLAFDASGALWVVDGGNGRVVEMASSIVVYLRNFDDIPLTVDHLYVNGALYTLPAGGSSYTMNPDSSIVVVARSVRSVVIMQGELWAPAGNYVIQAATTRGNVAQTGLTAPLTTEAC